MRSLNVVPLTVAQPTAEIGVLACALTALVVDGTSVAVSDSAPVVVLPCGTLTSLTNSTYPVAETVPDFHVTGPVVGVPKT